MSMPAAVVPLKAFAAAKTRLAPALDPGARSGLARAMADHVLRAAAPLTVFVATDDEAVAAWALAREARVVWTVGLDLNASIAGGVAAARDAGHDRVVIAHGDLPFAKPLVPLLHFRGITIVPDRHDDGTNVVCLPARVEFTPMYGRRSFDRHLSQLRATGTAVRIARRPDLQWDVDEPADLGDVVVDRFGASA